MARTPGDNQPLAREILRLRAENTTLTAELAKLREHADHDAGEILRLGGELANQKADRDATHDELAETESARNGLAADLAACVVRATKAEAERDAARAEVERLNIEIGRHPATRAWVTSGIRAIEEATSRADAAIRDRNEFAASELLAAIDAWAIAANVDWIKVVKDRAAELRQAASACPECDGSGTVEKCDWPGEHANRHQEPCPRGCKAAGAEVCGRCGATSAKDAEAKCRPEGDSCPGVGLWWRQAAGAAAPVEFATTSTPGAFAFLANEPDVYATPAADARQPAGDVDAIMGIVERWHRAAIDAEHTGYAADYLTADSSWRAIMDAIVAREAALEARLAASENARADLLHALVCRNDPLQGASYRDLADRVIAAERAGGAS